MSGCTTDTRELHKLSENEYRVYDTEKKEYVTGILIKAVVTLWGWKLEEAVDMTRDK